LGAGSVEPLKDPVGTESAWVVVPAFHEATVIRRTVADLRARFPHVVLVDDGSQDATAREALAAGAVVIRHAVNLGQGAALQTGIHYALTHGAAYIATFDADGQHHVEDLITMLDVLRGENLDIVLGSRFLGRADGLPLTRRLILKVAVLFTNLTTRVRLTDAHNGLRFMTAAAARQINIRQDQMAHASEIISQVGSLGLRYKEVPVTITYNAYSRAKGQRLSNSVRILTDLMTGWLSR
jgi:glycosyltransferase involved in cell wall biosynthesis